MCFSLAWLVNLLILLIVLGAVVAIIRLVLPRILANFGDPGVLIGQILNIILWAVVLIAIVVFAFELLSCLLGGSLHILR